ncbi:MAG: leucine-rich repeat protein [Chloroflexi bacterium]|nr:leucine-rich repeat protein [Chloroflexota bacterium]
MRLSIPSPLLRPWSLPGLAALLLLIAATVVIWAGTGPAGAQDGYQPDEQVVSDVWGYARETDNGFAHVLRWLRALHTFGAIEDMTAAEAQGYAEQYTAERWDPVVAELERLEADDGYEPDQQVTADVWDYARETGNGFAHVLRWLRVLKTFGEVSDMTSAEAQGYADQYTAERWNPVAAELSKLEAAATPPNRAPVVNTEAGHYYDFTGINNAPRGVLVSKPFHGVFSDPDGDELTYSVAIPGDQSHLVELLEVVRDEDVPVQEDKPREDGMLTRVWFRAEAAADWKALDPPLMNCPVVPATVTATDPEGLSVSLDAPFLIRWECYPEVVRATASREAIALTSDWEVESDPAPKPEQFTAHMVNGDGSQGTVAVSDVSVKGKVVRLALASELAEGQRVTVDYADDYRTPLRLAGGDDGTRAPGFTGQPVALDVSGPAFAAAKVSGATLKVTFNEELDAESTPSGSAFTVSARLGGGEARSIAGTATARVEGAVVTVGLAEAVHGGHTVTVAYAPPEDDPVRDLAGNPAGAFSGEDVTNETPAIDPGAPRMALISATIKGATLTLAYNNDVHLDWNTRSVPDVSRFAVTVNGETVSLAANRPVSVSTSTVILTLKQAVSASDTVTVSYTADWWDSIHSFGHRCCGYLYADNLTNHPVTNIMSDGRAPTLSAAAVEGAGQLVSVVDSKGAVVTLTFDEQLDPNAEPAPEAFSVTVNGVPVSFRSYSWRKGGRPVPALWDPVPIWINGHTVMLTLAGKVAVGHEVAVRYEPPQSGAKLQDLAGNPVAAFAATEVENRTRTSPPLIADAWNYARDTESGYDHVSRWLRLLKTLGALAQMTAAEAQGYADGGLPRWAPVAEDLRKLENAPGDYQPDAQVIDDVQGYARETGKGFPHVLRWMRTLQALGALADMTWAEAHGYANQHQAARWDPVAAELASMDAAKASIPVAPANFAISGAPGSLDLSATWDALEGATSYKLAWRQSGEEFETGDANTVSETEATVTVSGYGQWVMQLRACNEAGCGPTAWLPIVVSADAAPRTPTITPVCYRTPEVREILAKYVRKECADITAADLAEIDKIRWGDLEELTSLKSGDFDGLYNLEGLYFLDHQLTTLPEDIFNDLHSLQELQMSIWHGPFGGREGLTALPEDVFADLSNLRELDLAGNRLRTLPDGVFDGLSSLQTLNLEVTSLTALPEDVFDGLSSLQTLILEDNELSTLPAGVFDDLSSLQILNLHGNDLAELPDVFDGLSSLQTLNLSLSQKSGCRLGCRL